MTVRVRIDERVASFVAPAVLAFDGVTVEARDARMDAPLAATEARLRQSQDLDDVVGAVRAMYRACGVDPTKTRPSSEALLRRVRKGEGVPRINSMVDIGNWCSVEVQLPFGLYDRSRLAGDDIVLRLGRDGEGYVGIRKDHVNVAGRLTVADADGVFGNPTSDSARTMVTTGATAVVFVIYCPRDVPAAHRAQAIELTSHRVRSFTNGREVSAVSSPLI